MKTGRTKPVQRTVSARPARNPARMASSRLGLSWQAVKYSEAIARHANGTSVLFAKETWVNVLTPMVSNTAAKAVVELKTLRKSKYAKSRNKTEDATAIALPAVNISP